jgi:hypothetical protein
MTTSAEKDRIFKMLVKRGINAVTASASIKYAEQSSDPEKLFQLLEHYFHARNPIEMTEMCH